MGTRRLSLHVSALTDDEYDLYTPILDDLAPDGEDAVSVRETRAWLRGRYPEAPVDNVLFLFSPTMKAGDTMSRGEFLAAMRLLTHAQLQGNIVDRSLAFVQPLSNSNPMSPNYTQLHQSQATVPAPLPTPPKSQHSASTSMNPFAASQNRSHNPFRPSSRPGSISPTRRPFSPPLASPNRQPAPPIHPSSRSLNPRMSVSNPGPPLRPGSISPTRDAPILPPRKPQQAAPPPPRRPPIPPPKPKTHLTPLMQQSLQASKAGSAMKRAEESLEKTRVMQVLKSSSSGHNGPVVPPPLHSRASSVSGSSNTSSSERQALPSPPMSASSLEQVALAKPKPAGPPPRHPALSEDGGSTHTPRPPRHPALSDDGGAPSRPSMSLVRSKSVHYASPPSLSSRRKRPESVQVLMGDMTPGVGLSRHASLGPEIQRRLGKLMRPMGEDREGLMEDEKRGKGDWAARGSYDWNGDETPTPEIERDNLKWPIEEGDGWKRL